MGFSRRGFNYFLLCSTSALKQFYPRNIFPSDEGSDLILNHVPPSPVFACELYRQIEKLCDSAGPTSRIKGRVNLCTADYDKLGLMPIPNVNLLFITNYRLNHFTSLHFTPYQHGIVRSMTLGWPRAKEKDADQFPYIITPITLRLKVHSRSQGNIIAPLVLLRAIKNHHHAYCHRDQKVS